MWRVLYVLVDDYDGDDTIAMLLILVMVNVRTILTLEIELMHSSDIAWLYKE